MPYLNFFLFNSLEFWKTQEDAPQPESYVVVPAWSQTAGENASASGYFSCISSAHNLIFAGDDGKEDTKVGSQLGREVQLNCLA